MSPENHHWNDKVRRLYPAERQAQDTTMCRDCENCEYDLGFRANVTRDIISETRYGKDAYVKANNGLTLEWIVRTEKMAKVAVGFCVEHATIVDPYALVYGESFCDGEDFVKCDYPRGVSSVE